MIAKSDIFIVTVASALLLLAVVRSHDHVQTVAENSRFTTSMIAANTRVPVQPPASRPATRLATVDNSRTAPTDPLQATSSGEVITATAEEFQPPEVITTASYKTHIVKRGDVLSRIAQRYNTTVAELQTLNDLDTTVIHVGQKLVYPSP